MGSIRRRRWLAKKLGRQGMALLTALPTSLAPRRGPVVRALVYHRFGESERDPFCVTASEFDTQMRWLAERGLAVSMDRVRRFVAGEESLPDGSILVTIDDGFQSVHDIALPILREHAIPAVAFVSAAMVGVRPDGPVDDPVLSWEGLARLSEQGVSIGSHGLEHRSFGSMSLDEARHEAESSRAILEARLGNPVTAFAYPFGTRSDVNPSVGKILREVGYSMAFTAQHGALRPAADPMALCRVKVEGGEASWMFPLLCRGAIDAWAVVESAIDSLSSRD